MVSFTSLCLKPSVFSSLKECLSSFKCKCTAEPSPEELALLGCAMCLWSGCVVLVWKFVLSYFVLGMNHLFSEGFAGSKVNRDVMFGKGSHTDLPNMG